MTKKCSICRQGLIKRVQCSATELQNKAIQVFNKYYSSNGDGVVRINGPFECGHRYHLVCWLEYMRKLTAVSLFCGDEEGEILCPVKRCGGRFRSAKEIDIVPRSHYIPEILRSKCRSSIRQVRGNGTREVNNWTSWPSARRVIRARDVEIIDLTTDEEEKEQSFVESSLNDLDSLETSLNESLAKNQLDNALEDLARNPFDWSDILSTREFRASTGLGSDGSELASSDPSLSPASTLPIRRREWNATPKPPSPDPVADKFGFLYDYAESDSGASSCTVSTQTDGESRRTVKSDNMLVDTIANYLLKEDHEGKPYEPVVVVRRCGYRAMTLDLTKIDSDKNVVHVDRLPKTGKK